MFCCANMNTWLPLLLPDRRAGGERVQLSSQREAGLASFEVHATVGNPTMFDSLLKMT